MVTSTITSLNTVYRQTTASTGTLLNALHTVLFTTYDSYNPITIDAIGRITRRTTCINGVRKKRITRWGYSSEFLVGVCRLDLGPVSRNSRNFSGAMISYLSRKRRCIQAWNFAEKLPFRLVKGQDFRISRSQFLKWLSGPKRLRDFRETGSLPLKSHTCFQAKRCGYTSFVVVLWHQSRKSRIGKIQLEWCILVTFLSLLFIWSWKDRQLLYTLAWFTWKPYPISDQNGLRTIPFGTTHTYIAYIGEYPTLGKNNDKGYVVTQEMTKVMNNEKCEGHTYIDIIYTR